MSPKLSTATLESRRQAKLEELVGMGPVLQGSYAHIRVTCGNANCRCAHGEKHVSHIVTRKVRGKSKSLYVPVDMVEEVQAWIEQHRRVKRLLREISELSEKIIRNHVESKRRESAKGAGAASRRRPKR
jgi:hypothetical protein